MSAHSLRQRLRPLLIALSIVLVDVAILAPALLWSRLVVPGWKKGPLIDPAAPYSPENAIVLAAVAVVIVVDVYVLGLFVAQRRLGRRRWLPLAVLALALVAAEGGVRAWLAVDMVTYFRPHPTLHWQVRPGLDGFQNNADAGFITTNRDGMREVDLPRRKAPGEYRILVLGDSSNFGHGVNGDEMWSSVLEDIVAPLVPDRTVHVLNGACPGWTTYQALVFLDEIGLAYEPDMVIAGFNNDPGPDYLGDAERLTPEPVRTLNGLLWRSEVYLLAREAVLASARRLSPTEYQHYTAREAGRSPEYGKLADQEQLVPRVPMDAFVANVTTLEQLGLEQGYEFVWVDMPINRQLPDLVERYVNRDYRDAVGALSTKLGFPVIPVDRAFQTQRRRGLHLPGHVFHPSPVGHALVAQLVADGVREAGLLPAAAALTPSLLRFGCSSLTPVHAHVAVVLREHPELLDEAGLALELELYNSGKTQGKAVAQGQLQAFFTCGVPAVHMLASDPAARVVGSPGELGRIAVVARRSVATDLAELKGARVGLSQGSTPSMDWEVWGAGLDATVVPLRTEELQEALLGGSVDAVVSWDPWVEQWLQAEPELVVVAERPFWSVLAVDTGWAARQPQEAQAFEDLVERALGIAAANREHYDRAVAELSGWPVEVVRAVADRNRILSGRAEADLQTDPQAVQELERAARYAHGPHASGASLFAPSPGSGGRIPVPPEAEVPGASGGPSSHR